MSESECESQSKCESKSESVGKSEIERDEIGTKRRINKNIVGD